MSRLLSRTVLSRGSSLLRPALCRPTPAPCSLLKSSFSTHFTEKHEYVKATGEVGITDFAQSALGDIVYVELPDVGDEFEKGDAFGSVESVKAASDVYCPVGGTVTEVNSRLDEEPGLVNSEAEGEAWFIKIEPSDEGDKSDLMDEAAYQAFCDDS